ncbi:unnamed protein product, partial [Closterium sp. NIES-53]
DRERYFLLVVDDYMRYTTAFPLRSKGEVPDVLIPWIRAVCLQLRERFREDLPVLRLHSDRGGEFSSDLLRDFCHGEGSLQSFTLSASPHQNRVSERRVGLVMDVARTSMIHVAAPHFQWPFVVLYAAHQLNLVRAWLAFLPPHLGPCPLLSGSHVEPLPLAVPVEIAVDSGAARGAASGGAASGGAEPASAEPGGAEPQGADPRGAESEGAEFGGAEPEGAERGGTEPEGVELGGAESEGAESRVAEPRGTASAGGLAGALPRLSHRREPFSPQQLREWFAQRTRIRSGVAGPRGSTVGGTGAGGAGAAGRGGARTSVTGAAGAGGVGGDGARDPRARITGAGDPGARGAGARGAGAGDHGAGGTGAGGAGAGGARAGGAGAGACAEGTGAGDPRAGGAGAKGAGAGGPGAGGTV